MNSSISWQNYRVVLSDWPMTTWSSPVLWCQKSMSRWSWPPGRWCFTPVILATLEAEIRRIVLQSQPRQNVHAILSWETLHKNRAGEWLKVKTLSSSPRSTKKKKLAGSWPNPTYIVCVWILKLGKLHSSPLIMILYRSCIWEAVCILFWIDKYSYL
jgi:hypothetical protein